MTVRELKEKLANVNDNLEVTFCDYDNNEDADGDLIFIGVKGAEVIESQRKTWLSLYTVDDKK